MKKILAVIPARAGSKGIPNKNIRLLNGKPLIYYTIKNAIESKYITDVVVTTDSEEVILIAKQMEVNYKKRSYELSTDSVTLDSVVHDAIKDKKADYVITMQPTSPTLRVETLDAAIKYTIEENLDTVISGVNRPELSWTEVKGVQIPQYEKRINRQYLPKNYVETGAFLITKYEYVSENGRIGKNIKIFETTAEESVDIDSYMDLIVAREILNIHSVAFYVNGNNLRGLGHIYRVLELADEFYCKPDIYYDINQTDHKIFGETTHNIIGVDGIHELFEILRLKKYDIFINDILNTNLDYMISLRNNLSNSKIINFEDSGEGSKYSDMTFNALYQDSNSTNVYAGEKYYISSKSFLFYHPIRIKQNVNKVFISFGGADPQNYSDRLLKIVSKEKYNNITFEVVLGRAKSNVKELMKYNKYENINVYFDVKNIAEIMSECDVGVTSRGRTGYELAILGIPSMAMAQNKREEHHGFVSLENGFNYLGLNPSDDIIEKNLDIMLTMTYEDRLKQQKLLLKHDLKNGRDRVINLIKHKGEFK